MATYLALAEMKLKTAARDLEDARAMVEKSPESGDRDHLLRVIRESLSQTKRCLSHIDYMIVLSSQKVE